MQSQKQLKRGEKSVPPSHNYKLGNNTAEKPM